VPDDQNVWINRGSPWDLEIDLFSFDNWGVEKLKKLKNNAVINKKSRG
jgi:hypothetical protein